MACNRLFTAMRRPLPRASANEGIFAIWCAISDSLGVLGDEGRDLGLGGDGVVEGRKCRVRVGDGGGDAVKNATLDVLDVERDHEVCHGHLRAVLQFRVVVQKRHRGRTQQCGKVGREFAIGR